MSESDFARAGTCMRCRHGQSTRVARQLRPGAPKRTCNESARHARGQANGARGEGSPGARAHGSELLRRLASLARPTPRRGPRPWALRLASVGLIALAGLAALAWATPAQAQTTYISNIGQADVSGNVSVNFGGALAQQFTTGTDARGYKLSEVVVNIAWSSTTPEFELWTSNSSGQPGNEDRRPERPQLGGTGNRVSPREDNNPQPIRQVFRSVRKTCWGGTPYSGD